MKWELPTLQSAARFQRCSFIARPELSALHKGSEPFGTKTHFGGESQGDEWEL